MRSAEFGVRSKNRFTGRITWERRRPGELEFGIIYGIIAALVVFAARFLPLTDLLPSCAFKSIAGFACPTCGMTRSVTYFSHGEFMQAFRLNPLAASVLWAALAYFVYSLASLALDAPSARVSLNRAEGTAVRVIAVLLALVNWSYLIFFQ